MLSRHVQHPITGELFHISSDIGKTILKEYLVRGGMWGGASDESVRESKSGEGEDIDTRAYNVKNYLVNGKFLIGSPASDFQKAVNGLKEVFGGINLNIKWGNPSDESTHFSEIDNILKKSILPYFFYEDEGGLKANSDMTLEEVIETLQETEGERTIPTEGEGEKVLVNWSEPVDENIKFVKDGSSVKKFFNLAEIFYYDLMRKLKYLRKLKQSGEEGGLDETTDVNAIPMVDKNELATATAIASKLSTVKEEASSDKESNRFVKLFSGFLDPASRKARYEADQRLVKKFQREADVKARAAVKDTVEVGTVTEVGRAEVEAETKENEVAEAKEAEVEEDVVAVNAANKIQSVARKALERKRKEKEREQAGKRITRFIRKYKKKKSSPPPIPPRPRDSDNPFARIVEVDDGESSDDGSDDGETKTPVSPKKRVSFAPSVFKKTVPKTEGGFEVVLGKPNVTREDARRTLTSIYQRYEPEKLKKEMKNLMKFRLGLMMSGNLPRLISKYVDQKLNEWEKIHSDLYNVKEGTRVEINNGRGWMRGAILKINDDSIDVVLDGDTSVTTLKPRVDGNKHIYLNVRTFGWELLISTTKESARAKKRRDAELAPLLKLKEQGRERDRKAELKRKELMKKLKEDYRFKQRKTALEQREKHLRELRRDNNELMRLKAKLREERKRGRPTGRRAAEIKLQEQKIRERKERYKMKMEEERMKRKYDMKRREEERKYKDEVRREERKYKERQLRDARKAKEDERRRAERQRADERRYKMDMLRDERDYKEKMERRRDRRGDRIAQPVAAQPRVEKPVAREEKPGFFKRLFGRPEPVPKKPDVPEQPGVPKQEARAPRIVDEKMPGVVKPKDAMDKVPGAPRGIDKKIMPQVEKENVKPIEADLQLPAGVDVKLRFGQEPSPLNLPKPALKPVVPVKNVKGELVVFEQQPKKEIVVANGANNIALMKGMYVLNEKINIVKKELDDMKLYRDNVELKQKIMKQVKKLKRYNKRKTQCCSLCGSRKTNKVDCPLNKKATLEQNPYSKTYKYGTPKRLPNGEYSKCPGNPDTHKKAVRWLKHARRNEDDELVGDYVPLQKQVIITGKKNMPACEKFKPNKPLLKKDVKELVGGGDDDSLLQLYENTNLDVNLMGEIQSGGNTDADSLLNLIANTDLDVGNQVGGGSMDTDSVLDLFASTDLDVGNQVGGGETDTDSLLDLLVDTDLDVGNQVGGGETDTDSLLDLFASTDLDDNNQIGGGETDTDSVLDLIADTDLDVGNQVGGGETDTDSVLDLADTLGLDLQAGGGDCGADTDSLFELINETGILNNQSGGDQDSVLGLLYGTDLEVEGQIGGGDMDNDSLLDLANDVFSKQMGGGEADDDSVLDMANKAGLL